MTGFSVILHGDPIPSGYRLAQTYDVRNSLDQVKLAMTGDAWMVAELVDGEVLGKSIIKKAQRPRMRPHAIRVVREKSYIHGLSTWGYCMNQNSTVFCGKSTLSIYSTSEN